MKIGLLHYSMPPTVGGVEQIIAAHQELFLHYGHEVVCFCDQKNSPAPLYNTVPGFVPGSDSETHTAEIVQYLQAQSLDLLIVHNVFTMPFCLAATQACHFLAASDLPVISWVHDLAATNPRYLVPPDSLLRRHPAGARVVAISVERAATYTAVTGFAEIEIVPNGIHAFGGLHGPLPATHPHLAVSLAGAFPILFHPTRILRRKNIAHGIRLIAELKKLHCAPCLLITGAPEPFSGDQATYRAELHALTSSLGTQSEVLFLGDTAPLANADVERLYAIVDALFFPSEHEGFGLPILEAGLQRLPMFVSDTQPLASLAAQNGLVFPLDLPPEKLAAQVADFFSKHTVSHVQRAIRRDFDWQEIYQKHILHLLSPTMP